LQLVADRVVQDHVDGAERQEVLDSLLGANGTTKLAYCVSDPSLPDCPLMFVSAGFENATGYKAEFATGRSCRFLQPTSRVINDALNSGDCQLMKDFCKEPLPEGTTLVNLLLNEHINGRRFWNLLKMEHVYLSGKCYIFAVQSVVDSYMPKVLQKRVKDKSADKKVAEGLKQFLKKLRKLRSEIEGSKEPIHVLNSRVKSGLQKIQSQSMKYRSSRGSARGKGR